MNDLDHLSYSSIKAYLTCARAWKYQYVEKVPTYATSALVFGSAIHNAIEAYVKSDRSQPPATFWDSAWQAATGSEGKEVAWGAERPEEHYNEGLRILGNDQVQYNLATIQASTDDQGHKIERRVELRVPGVPIPIIGYIDIQMADGVPGDFKTSSRSWTSDQAQEETQSLFYLAALNQAGATVEGWRFRHLVIVKTKTPQMQIFEHRHAPGEIFWLFGMIGNVWTGIQADVFPENPGTWKCNPRFCDFWSRCRGKYQ